MSAFRWSESATAAALSLANGETQKEAADKAEVSERTVRRWLQLPEFAEEVDRLTLMTDIASKAERLRIAKRMVRQIRFWTQKDLLDWLKYAQSETDGIKLDLTQLLSAVTEDDPSVARSGPKRIPGPADEDESSGE